MTGAQLKKSREALGLNQIQLARQLGMHPVSISRFEHGHETIPRVIEWALKGLAAAGVDPATEPPKKPARAKKPKPKK